MSKLNFGCGSIQPEGWYNVDVEDFGQEYVGSTELFLPDKFDMIVAHCSIQITEWHDLDNLFKELLRILKPNGVLRISLPDIMHGFKAYKEGHIQWFPNSEDNLDERFSAWLTWYSTTKTLLTDIALCKKLTDAGFRLAGLADFKFSVVSSDEITELDTREGECYFVEAVK